MKIMFVCTGNICRSPLAEALFEHLVREQGVSGRFEPDSSGTTAYHVGQRPDERMQLVASSHGVTIRHRSKQLEPADFEEFDLLLAMDRSNLRDMRRMAEHANGGGEVRMFREFDPEGGADLEVPDPYYGGQSGFERVYEMVYRTNRALLSRLLDREKSLSGSPLEG